MSNISPAPPEDGRVKCTACNQIKFLEDFHRNRAARDGRAFYCKTCSNARSREWAKKARPPIVVRLCGICGQKKPLRRELCRKCTLALGCLDWDLASALRALEFLEGAQKPENAP